MEQRQKYWKIAISGDLGSGKSTVCHILEQKLACTIYSTGKIQRQIAEKYNMTTLELNKYSETNPEIDNEIDSAVAALGKKAENIVFDSRLAWHFVPNSLKIHLTVDSHIAAERILHTNRGKSESYASVEEALDKVTQRKSSENSRYLQIYGVDCTNWENYDLIIDTSLASPESIAQLIITKLDCWQAGRHLNKIWLSPETLYPTISVQEMPPELHRAEYISLIKVDELSYIVEGHHHVSTDLINKVDLVPAKILAANEETIAKNGETAREYAQENATISKIAAWEEKHKFKFLRYPDWVR